MRTTLTQDFVDELQPKEKRYEVRDALQPGFILRVNPTGKKVYICEPQRGKKINIANATSISPSEARKTAKRWLQRFATGEDLYEIKHKKPKGAITFEQYIDEDYAPWRIAHRTNGKDDIHRLKTHFYPLFSKSLLTSLEASKLDKWRTQRINDNIHPETVNRDINVLKAAISKAVEWKLLKENPFTKIKALQFKRKPRVRYLTEEEVKSLNKAIKLRANNLAVQREQIITAGLQGDPGFAYLFRPDHMETLITLSLNTGARRGELFNLTWTEVDFDNKTIGLIGKSQKLRHVPMNDKVYKTMRAWQALSPNDTELVFTQPNGFKLKSVQKQWESIKKNAQLENFTWHDMRHHFASWLVMSSVDLNTVRELLGHDDIKMTIRYAHLAPEHKALAVAKLPKF